jgi:hypothetical protein
VHRGDRSSGRRGHRDHDDPLDGGPGLFGPPAGLAPQGARVTLRDLPGRPPRRPGVWIGRYKVHALDAVAATYGAAVLVAIFTRNFLAVVIIVAAGLVVTLAWR